MCKEISFFSKHAIVILFEKTYLIIKTRFSRCIFVLGSVPWSAVIFLSFVCLVLAILIVLILYFEKVCCFARYRFLKHFLRRITRTKQSKTPVTTAQLIAVTPLSKSEDEKINSSSSPDHLYIAGQPESLTSFAARSSILLNDSSKRM